MPGITVFAKDEFAPTVARLMALIGPRLAGRFEWATYDAPLRLDDIQSTVILTDFERLDAATMTVARQLYLSLVAEGRRVLNDPHRVLVRLPLLQALYAAGINDFTGHDVDAPRDGWRWPVFLRRYDDHNGAVSPLLHCAAEYERSLDWRRKRGRAVNLMATEYCDVASVDGLYRKYGAFRIGGTQFAAHMVFADNWAGKSDVALTDALYAEAYEYVVDFPHAEAVARVFERAQIEFGRIDYAVKDGQLRVWEINTLPNPVDFRESVLPTDPCAPLYYERLTAALNTLICS